MSKSDANLDGLRQRIDELDEEIVARLNQRADLVVKIGQTKRQAGRAVFVPQRERQVLDRVRRCNQGPLPDPTITAIYRELMSGSFALEHPPRIAYLGPVGSYSHLAAVRKFGSSVDFEGLDRIEAVFEEVERHHVDLGLVPIENSLGGGVVDTLDAFMRHNVRICAEINLAVHHHLLGRCNLDQIEKIYSKPEAFRQCHEWLTETGLYAKTHPATSTSKAAELAAAEPNAAAIGSALAADLYDLPILRDRVEDNPDNVTRFLVISTESAAPTGADKTSLIFSGADRPGSLVEILDIWRQAGINMTFIESRPARHRNWAYSFFVDLEGHAEAEPVQSAIDSARQICAFLEVLGSFPKPDEVFH
ncbi:MAG: prephenate dehydratase [Phycisphaerae bacterium]